MPAGSPPGASPFRAQACDARQSSLSPTVRPPLRPAPEARAARGAVRMQRGGAGRGLGAAGPGSSAEGAVGGRSRAGRGLCASGGGGGGPCGRNDAAKRAG